VKTIWFDATFGRPWVITLENLFSMRKESEPFLRHIYAVSKPKEQDPSWISKLDENEFIIISGDRGNKKPRLPQICREKQITHIILSSTVHHSSRFERARAIIMLWPHLLETFEAPSGSRFQIEKSGVDYALIPKN